MTELKPLLKWIGGKRRLMNDLKRYFPTEYETYYEPFLGGASVFFNILPKKAVLSDINDTLIKTYCVLRDNLNELNKYLVKLEGKNDEKNYYKYRDEFNILKKTNDDDIYLVALMMYLNKTCFSGIYRENSKGEFNVPYGKYKKINIIKNDNLTSIQEYLKNNDIKIQCLDYHEAIIDANENDFIYLDPPYHKENKTSFTKYNKSDFKEHEELFLLLKKLDKKGVKFLLSNSNTQYIKNLYKDFNIKELNITRNINNSPNVNKKTNLKNNELIIFNYDLNKVLDKKNIKI